MGDPRDGFMYTPFNGDGPEGMWNPSRATDEFKSKGLLMVGGSMSQDGKNPYDDNPNNAAGRPATMQDVWGVKFQGSHLGSDVI